MPEISDGLTTCHNYPGDMLDVRMLFSALVDADCFSRPLTRGRGLKHLPQLLRSFNAMSFAYRQQIGRL